MKIKLFILLFFISLNLFSTEILSDDTLNIDTGYIKALTIPDGFKEKYIGDDYIYEYNIDATKKSQWKEFKEWITSVMKDLFGFTTSEEAQIFVGYLIKIIYFHIFILVVVLIIRSLIKKEGSWIFGRKSKSLDINSTSIEENLLETDLKRLIEKAIANKDYRLATRFYYLETLKKLNQKGIINWEFEKTNLDFLNEIKDKTTKKQFSYISYLYNYSWYGEFTVDNTDFLAIQSAFGSISKMIE